jgi:hypothetical protein
MKKHYFNPISYKLVVKTQQFYCTVVVQYVNYNYIFRPKHVVVINMLYNNGAIKLLCFDYQLYICITYKNTTGISHLKTYKLKTKDS